MLNGKLDQLALFGTAEADTFAIRSCEYNPRGAAGFVVRQ